jgi:acyl-coenzyme A synthetase/AMP-(fatty) acid ligase
MNDSFIKKIELHALRNPEKIAIVHKFRRISYGTLWIDILKTESWLRQQGVCVGEWVAITVRDQYLHILISLALLRQGCSQIGLPSFERVDTHQRTVDRLPLAWQVVEDPSWRIGSLRTLLITSLPEIDVPNSVAVGCDKNSMDSCVVFTSSGTTGKHKLLPIDRDSLIGAMTIEWNAKQVIHQRITVEYSIGKKGVWRALLAGGTIVTSENGSIENIMETWSKFGVTDVIVTGHIAQQLLAHSEKNEWGKLRMDHIKFYLSSSKISLELLEGLRSRLSRNLVISYSTTESGPVTWATYEDLKRNEHSVGYCAKGVSIQIVDENYDPVPAGVQGLIGIKSDACAKRYLFDDELNVRHFRDGWFYPGDIGCVTDDGMLIFYGRADDMMIMGSINIFPAEIESIARTCPGIDECAAFPIKSGMYGAIPALAVVSNENLDIDDVLTCCRKVLGIRAPRKIFQVNEIPRNAQGKVLRLELARIAEMR